MSPLNIVLADLTYFNRYTETQVCIPVGIGYIASYVKSIFFDKVSIELYKNPEELLSSIYLNKPKIVGLSLFYWNTALVKLVISGIKARYGDEVFIVLGGQSIDDIPEIQEAIFDDTGADALIPREGETGFANLVSAFLNVKMASKIIFPVDGVIFNKKYNVIAGKAIGFELNLSNVPSPYTAGVLDKFLNGGFNPIIQTSRLCPYTCVFCTVGKNEGKLRTFDLETIEADIEYISTKMKNHSHKMLLLSDDNFGIFERDIKIAEMLVRASKKFGYPKSISFYSDKKFTESSREVVKILKNLSFLGLPIALQSDNPETLRAIKRKNLSDTKIEEAIKWAGENDISTTTELLFGLPYETKDSFIKSIESIVKRGIDSVLCHNLFILPDSEMNRIEYRKKHNIQSKFRLLVSHYAEIDGSFCAEYDEVVVGSNDFNFDDFMDIRRLNFMFYAVFTLDFYKWFFQLLRLEDISITSFFEDFINPDRSVEWTSDYLSFLDDFNAAVRVELFDTKEEVFDYAKKCWNANNKSVGESSQINVLFGARLIYLEQKWVSDVILTHLKNYISADSALWSKALEVIAICRDERIDLKNMCEKDKIICNYDYNKWKKDKFQNKLDCYKVSEKRLRFNIDFESRQKITAFNETLGSMSDIDYYYSSIYNITPRYKTLHTFILEEIL